jgi:hypothetical protein
VLNCTTQLGFVCYKCFALRGQEWALLLLLLLLLLLPPSLTTLRPILR